MKRLFQSLKTQNIRKASDRSQTATRRSVGDRLMRWTRLAATSSSQGEVAAGCLSSATRNCPGMLGHDKPSIYHGLRLSLSQFRGAAWQESL